MSIVALSGWGQPHDALNEILPMATHVPYGHFATTLSMFEKLQSYQPKVAVGWSLGGQLLARAVAGGYISPRKLVLLSAPYQFVKSSSAPVGMPIGTFKQFQQNFAEDAERTIKRVRMLIAHKDVNERFVVQKMPEYDSKIQSMEWKFWLDELERFNGKQIDFAAFPKTLIIQGDRDQVVEQANANYFQRHIPNAHRVLLPGCGHAPHWHDQPLVRELIEKFISQ